MRIIKNITGIPPLIIIGTIIVLFPIFVYMTVDRINKQKSQSIRLMVEKSTALIRAFEAGTYSGMMNMGWNSSVMENLLRETAALPDITYLFIVDKQGIVLVHNRSENKGMVYGKELDLDHIIKTNQTGWQILEDKQGNKVFEVHKKFTPVQVGNIKKPKGMMSMHRQMNSGTYPHAQTYEETVIFVGLDMALIDQANKGDTQHSIMMAVILALIGFTGFVLVFVVQRYAQARSSLSMIQIFSDNLVENMPVGLIATNTKNQIISVNPAAKSILNIEPGLKTEDLEPRFPKQIENLLSDISEKKELVEKEIHINMAKVSVILEVIASPLLDKEGDSLGALLILRDKTELNTLKTRMEENKRLAAIGRLAAGVAHEIRNPLSSLKGYATFFKEVFDTNSENYGIADVMTKEVDRLDRVVSELVELAKPVAVSGNPLDLDILIMETTQQVTYSPGAENIDIKTDFDADLPQIHADADRLKQVFLNLCLNGVQAMEEKGSGILRIEVHQDADAQNVVIVISDTGCGIKKEELTHIFEPYFTTKLSGIGLGLAIVKNIVKAHKGTITVASKPDSGTQFTIILPIRMS